MLEQGGGFGCRFFVLLHAERIGLFELRDDGLGAYYRFIVCHNSANLKGMFLFARIVCAMRKCF